MLFIPSFGGHKRKLETVLCLAQIFLVFCTLFPANQAGVIKKQDTIVTAIESGITNLTEVQPKILTDLRNASEVATTKLQSVKGTDFSPETETSKELSNNEILTIAAKKLLEEENKIKNANNEKDLKVEGNSTLIPTKHQNNFHDVNEIILELENKEKQISGPTTNTTEFSSNDIKEDKIQKFRKNTTPSQATESPNENLSSLENNLKTYDEISQPASINSTESKSVKEASNANTKVQETQLKSIIENHSKDLNKHFLQLENKNETSKEQNENVIKTESKETSSNNVEIMLLENVTTKPIVTTTSNALPTTVSTPKSNEDVLNTLEINKDEEDVFKFKALKSNQEEESIINLKSLKTREQEQEALKSITLETYNDEKEAPNITENFEGLEATTITPVRQIENQSFEISTKPQSSFSQDQSKNIIHDGLDRNELVKSNEIKETIITNTESSLEADNKTNLQHFSKEQDLLIFESDKKEYARSILTEEKTTTLDPKDLNEVLVPVTTFRPIVLSIKKGVEENVSASHIKEKKPKFINDNSTNAQQLNLPNNAEVWSLAAMKSLPKANVTVETAPTHNQTLKDYKESTLQNVTLTMNSNSEKNLLDWSQIMMDKELSSTTTRNEDFNKQQEPAESENENQLTNGGETNLGSSIKGTTTLANKQDITEFKQKPKEDAVTNTLVEPKLNSSEIFFTTMAAILSDTNNESGYKTDKKFEENMNNHLETLTETLDVATSTTTAASAANVNNKPLNTTLNIEPNLSETNLTSNVTQTSLNNELHNTTTTTKKLSGDVKVNADAAPTTTEATAVVYSTTLEQISSDTTTVSTPETSKQDTSLNNVIVIAQQQKYKNINKNVNFEEPYTSTATNNELENAVQEKNQYENNELKTKTATIVPITTFRPIILAITSTTSIPATFEQEIDQNGNEIQINLTKTNAKQQQQQSTIINDNNSTKTIETHLSEREFLTSTIAPIPIATTILSESAVSKIENTLTSSLENNIVTTTTSSSESELKNETTEINLESRETTIKTTPKQVDETTIGSPVLTEETLLGKEESEITTETILSTTLTNETPKAPVVFETQGTTTTTEHNLIVATTTDKQEDVSKEDFASKNNAKPVTTISVTTTATMSTTTTSPALATTAKEDETYISLLDDTTTTTTQTYSPTISTTSHTLTTTPIPSQPASTSTLPSAITTKVEEIYNVIHSTTTELIQTTTQQLLTETEEDTYSNYPTSTFSTTTTNSNTEMLPPAVSTTSSHTIISTSDIGKSLPTLTSIMGGNSGNMYPKNSDASGETDVNVIIAITVSVIGVIALILLVGFLYLMRKRQKQNSYPNRCRPVSMDEFTIDNASVGGSMRKSSVLRSSKRTYGNLAFDDPSLRHNAMGVHELAKFTQEKLRIFEEFRDVPQITSRLDEVPPGCEDKNRYANVLPLPETRVILQRLNDDEKTEYINANYVTGPKDAPNYYIACQAPLESTVEDFWRMIWEQQSRVIIQATDLIENGVEKCAEYLPPSVTLDNHSIFGDFQITLQNREVKDKYAISTILLKNVAENSSRELTHYWYKWPEVGVPSEEAPIIAMLLEARSSLISYAIEQANDEKDKSSMATLKSAEDGTVSNNSSTTAPTNNSNVSSANGSSGEINGNISTVHIKKAARNQGPLTVHCSPGTGRTGTIIACDIAIRSLETPKRTVDIPQIVYYVRRGRASAVLTKEQYEFIYKVANMYAAKITNPTNYN